MRGVSSGVSAGVRRRISGFERFAKAVRMSRAERIIAGQTFIGAFENDDVLLAAQAPLMIAASGKGRMTLT
jgi:hypothetical protein